MTTTIQDFFKWGLDRDIPPLLDPPLYRAIKGGSDDKAGRRFYTMSEAPHREPMGIGEELPWINLGPGDKKVIKHREPLAQGRTGPSGGSGFLIQDTVGVGPKNNKLTDIEWFYPEPLPFKDESVGCVHAHQFLEHFHGEDVIEILHEIQRVLVPGGVVFITVPYAFTAHWAQALDHKSTFNEETWNWLFSNDYYDDHTQEWRLEVHACFIMGIVIRNLDLFTQLVKR